MALGVVFQDRKSCASRRRILFFLFEIQDFKAISSVADRSSIASRQHARRRTGTGRGRPIITQRLALHNSPRARKAHRQPTRVANTVFIPFSPDLLDCFMTAGSHAHAASTLALLPEDLQLIPAGNQCRTSLPQIH